ncbi:MAG: hypothetical protein PHT84_05935 [Candidatus Pacebacteria bacterium]|nr:hypothetical protein [Candidatus Paceibacterota bacterium]
MRRNLLFLGLATAVVTLAVGCGSGYNAADIAQSYGILNRCDLQPKIASIIQSGEADKMINNGSAAVRSRVQNCGSNKILVSEYLIEGEVYRIEVRKTFNPLKNIPCDSIRYGYFDKGLDKDYICWFQLSSVIDSLKNNSFSADYVVAYRAWRDLNGKVHPVRVEEGITPDWVLAPNGLNLNLHTTLSPMQTVWVQGAVSDGRHKALGAPADDYDVQTGVVGHRVNAASATDCRWLLMADGMSGRSMNAPIPFVNLDLAGKVLN